MKVVTTQHKTILARISSDRTHFKLMYQFACLHSINCVSVVNVVVGAAPVVIVVVVVDASSR